MKKQEETLTKKNRIDFKKAEKDNFKREKRKRKGLKKSRFNFFLENIKHFQVAFYKDCWYNIFVIKKVFYV